MLSTVAGTAAALSSCTVTDRIVDPSNGPKTRELARAVQRDLLPQEPYRSYGITLDDFFTKASPRMEVDLVALSDRLKGWYTNDRWLRDVGLEAVRAHPRTYSRGVAGSTWGLLKDPLYRSPPPAAASAAHGASSASASGAALPTPSEGEPIPAPHEGGITTPDGSIYTVWTSPTVLPSRITVTSSEMARTSSSLCVIITIVLPCSFIRRRMPKNSSTS